MFNPVSGKKASSIDRVLLVDEEEVELDWVKLENVLEELETEELLELVDEMDEEEEVVEVEDDRDVERYTAAPAAIRITTITTTTMIARPMPSRFLPSE